MAFAAKIPRPWATLAVAVVLFLSASSFAKETRHRDAKAEALSYLQEMRALNVKRLKEIDDTLRVRIEDTAPSSLEFEIGRLKFAKREHTLRQEFLDRLIFQVDVKFAGGDLRPFLERALTEMAKVDATTATAQNDLGLWKFLKFSADAIHRLPEKKENILIFLDGYMNRSVANPIRPEDYLNTRNYSNGLDSESGHPVEREVVGDIVEQRIRSIKEVTVAPMQVIPKQTPAPAAPSAEPPAVVPAAATPSPLAAPIVIEKPDSATRALEANAQAIEKPAPSVAIAPVSPAATPAPVPAEPSTVGTPTPAPATAPSLN